MITSNIISGISALISLCALMVSIWHWISDYIKEKPNINLTLRGYRPKGLSQKINPFAVFSVIIENKSKLDIAITRMYLTVKGETLEFEWQEKSSVFNNKLVIQNQKLPIHIVGMGAFGGHCLIFEKSETNINLNNLSNTPFSIKVITSRGYSKTFKFEKCVPIVDV